MSEEKTIGVKTFEEMTTGEKFLSGATPCMKLPSNLGFVSLITGELNFFNIQEGERFVPAEVLQRRPNGVTRRL